MRHPSLTQRLLAAGARFEADPAASEPLDFGDAAAEAERAFAGGICDRSSAAHLLVRGNDRVDFVNRLCTNDLTKVDQRLGVSAALTNAKGRVLDRVLVYSRGDALCLSGSNHTAAHLHQWLQKFIVMEDCTVEDRTSAETRLLVCGLAAPQAVKKVLQVWPEPSSAGFGVASASLAGHPVWVVRMPAPGGHGAELQIAAEQGAVLFSALCEVGLAPVGATAYGQARIEAGIPELPREIGEHSNPLECGLRDSVSFTKGCYIGQEVVARLQHYHKVRRSLAYLRFPYETDPADLREVFVDLLRIGEITSAVRSRRLQATVALAFLNPQYATRGAKVHSVARGEPIHGTVEEFPSSG